MESIGLKSSGVWFIFQIGTDPVILGEGCSKLLILYFPQIEEVTFSSSNLLSASMGKALC